jgi:insulysin
MSLASIRFVQRSSLATLCIQSEREAVYLEERIDSFLNGFEKQLEDMPEEQFDKEKSSLVNRLREDYKNLHSE